MAVFGSIIDCLKPARLSRSKPPMKTVADCNLTPRNCQCCIPDTRQQYASQRSGCACLHSRHPAATARRRDHLRRWLGVFRATAVNHRDISSSLDRDTVLLGDYRPRSTVTSPRLLPATANAEVFELTRIAVGQSLGAMHFRIQHSLLDNHQSPSLATRRGGGA